MSRPSRVTAVLGPTNTGKTHYAIERMLAHRTGVIGLPLRLLAREVYDRIVAARGPSVVALVTGEERIVPERTQFWVCTTEAMPLDIGADFVAVDEIQLCADPDRGHVFTERLLHARGLVETMFMGSETMRGAIAALVPGVQVVRRERFSELAWAGAKRIARMPARSAIVAFSVENVYAIAELIRRTKGGCALVMGALSPRTRNAQVALYQNGDVDYLVATDAIGMGLNLDVRHVAFAGTAKFDGRRMRPLNPDELAQIAGRAGRHTNAGTFGVTGEARPLAPEVIAAIENHQFLPVRKLHWRNGRLDFGTPSRLIASLERPTDDPWLTRVREAEDLTALKALVAMPEVAERVRTPQDVQRLWDICRVPDFRGISPAEHAGLLARLHGFIHDGGRIPSDWMARNIERIDRTQGDIDTLSRRLAFIRTWTYVAQRPGWLDDEAHWRDTARAVEDRLSDALHACLTAQFVDRRTSVLMRRLKQKESLVAEVNDKGEVTVEGETLGRLQGFRFQQDRTASSDEARTLRQAAYAALAPVFNLRADRFYNAPDTEMDLTEQGGLMWGTEAVGKLVAGAEPLRPQVAPFVDEEAGPEVAEKVRRRLQHFIDRRIAAQMEPLHALQRDETLTGLSRGFAFRLVEALGVIAREGVADEVKALDQEARAALRKHGIRFGQYTIFLPALLKPAPTRLRLVLWSLAQGLDTFPESPPPGLVTIPHLPDVPAQHYTLAGYRPAGTRAIRIDMLERLADMLRQRDARAGFEAVPEMLSITGLTLVQFVDLMAGLGYGAERGERPKTGATPVRVESTAEEIAAAAEARAAAESARLMAAIAETGASAEAPADAVPATAPEVSEAAVEAAEAPAAADSPAAPEAAPVAVETEVFYLFRWAPRPRAPRADGRGERRSGPPRRDRAPGAEGEAATRPDRKRHDNRSRPDGRGPRGDAAPVQAAAAGAGPDAEPRPGAPAEAAEGRDRPARRDGGRRDNQRGDGPREGGREASRDRPKPEGRDGTRERASDRDSPRDQPRGRDKDHPRGPKGRDHGPRDQGPRTFSSGPERRKDRIDPDNPFAAALMGLRDKT